jgi:hypothetical protein
MNTGFFIMKDAVDVLHFESVSEAKNFLLEKVANFVKTHPGTRANNVVKVEKMIKGAASLEALSRSVANLVLAHPSENLKVLK